MESFALHGPVLDHVLALQQTCPKKIPTKGPWISFAGHLLDYLARDFSGKIIVGVIPWIGRSSFDCSF